MTCVAQGRPCNRISSQRSIIHYVAIYKGVQRRLLSKVILVKDSAISSMMVCGRWNSKRCWRDDWINKLFRCRLRLSSTILLSNPSALLNLGCIDWSVKSFKVFKVWWYVCDCNTVRTLSQAKGLKNMHVTESEGVKHQVIELGNMIRMLSFTISRLEAFDELSHCGSLPKGRSQKRSVQNKWWIKDYCKHFTSSISQRRIHRFIYPLKAT